MSRPRFYDAAAPAAAVTGSCPCPQGAETERAWAARFFDGEGCVSLIRDRRGTRRPRLFLSIEQVDRRPLERFRDAAGFAGKITQRPARRAPNRQIIHRLSMGHAATLQTIGILWPWLSGPNREQLEHAVAEIGDDVDPSSVA